MKTAPEQNIEPDRWVLVELTQNGETYRKIISSWKGGWLQDSDCRISSRIVESTVMQHFNEYKTETGSTYKCLHSKEGISEMIRDVITQLRELNGNDSVRVICYGDFT